MRRPHQEDLMSNRLAWLVMSLSFSPAALASPHAGHRSHAHVLRTADGAIQNFATPTGWGAKDLQAAYSIGPAVGPATIAIVDAYGDTSLEHDLGVYRAQYGLPPCTRANGCLTIVNDQGQTSPLPGPQPTTDQSDWPGEQMLDVDMASAACPTCKILMIQTSNTGDSM